MQKSLFQEGVSAKLDGVPAGSNSDFQQIML